jgi:hypothetical protein
MPKHHLAVIKNSIGKPETHPFKSWLKVNSQVLPIGMDAVDNTTYQLRRALKKDGWEIEELPDRVLVIQPDDKKDTSYADELLGEDAEITDETNEEVLIEAEEITFGLERDLQAALRANIEQLEPGLKIIDKGKERLTEAGRIDITAFDKKGNVVIIELKAGEAKHEIITQVLAYMTAVAEADKKPVRGILVAGTFPKKVILASRAIPNLEIKQYSFQFTFAEVL